MSGGQSALLSIFETGMANLSLEQREITVGFS
jgi:hypothetical protein